MPLKKLLIKVIKRPTTGRIDPPAPEVTKSARAVRMEIEQGVSTWITERETNRESERTFSNDKIASWALIPEAIIKT